MEPFIIQQNPEDVGALAEEGPEAGEMDVMIGPIRNTLSLIEDDAYFNVDNPISWLFIEPLFTQDSLHVGKVIYLAMWLMTGTFNTKFTLGL